jgi:hypothetical protein
LKLKKLGKVTQTIMAFCLIAMAVSFQNCSPGSITGNAFGLNSPKAQSDTQQVSSSSFTAGNTATSGTGNGHGYDGKPGIYVSQLAAGAKCPDGSNINSEIQVTSARQAFFIRQSCADIAPLQVDYSQIFSIPASNQFLLYNGNAFQYSASVDSLNLTLFVCSSVSQVSPLSVLIGMGMMGNYTAQFQTSQLDSGTFAAQFTMSGINMAYQGSDSAADALTLVITNTNPDGSYSASASVKYGQTRTSSNTDLSSVSMVCYQQAH